MGRIARDLVAIAGLSVERVALHVEDRHRSRERSARRRPASKQARDIRWDATWKAAAVGAAASAAPDPTFGIASGAIEAALMSRIETSARSRLNALCPETSSLHGAEIRRVIVHAAATKAAWVVAERAGLAVGRAALKELGVAVPRLGARAVLGAAAPIATIAWSAAWNGVEMHRRLTPAVRAVEAARADGAMTKLWVRPLPPVSAPAHALALAA